MNRRGFLWGAAGVLAGATSASTRASDSPPDTLDAPATIAPPLPGVVQPGGLLAPALLDRAKAALDRHKDAFALRERFGIADFARHSRELRFHIVDLVGGQRWSYLVAHGIGSDPEHSGYLKSFSNEIGSRASSSGAYRTSEIYEGSHGQSMRLVGLDPTNDNADIRAVVIHGASYVSEDHIAQWGKCGRSDGCLAFAPHRLNELLGLLGPGRLIYADKL